MIGEVLNTNTMIKYLFQQAHKQFTVKASFYHGTLTNLV